MTSKSIIDKWYDDDLTCAGSPSCCVEECDLCVRCFDRLKSAIQLKLKERKAELEKGCKHKFCMDCGSDRFGEDLFMEHEECCQMGNIGAIQCGHIEDTEILLCNECQARLAQLKEDAEMLGVLLE